MATKKAPNNPYEDIKFEKFLEILEENEYENWTFIAEALGVHRKTIERWRKHSDARRIIAKSVNEDAEMMKKVGKRDWRMWRDRLKMKNVADVDKQDITTDGEKIDGPVIYKPKRRDKDGSE